MNIPYCILKNKTSISPQAYDYHQSLGKKLYNLTKKLKSTNFASCTKENNNIKNKIYKWLFNLDFNIRLKICSIYNDWFTSILFQLLTYDEYDNDLIIYPRMIYENFYKKINPKFDDENYDYKKDIINIENNNYEENFNTFFQVNKSENHNNKDKQREKDFLKELRFFSINKYNDTLTLSQELLKNKTKLQEYFDTFSNCKIFSKSIMWMKAKNNNNIFNFSFPNWINNYNFFTIPQLVVICFEQIISIYYQIYLIDGNIPEFDIDSKINDFLNMNKNIENYLGKELPIENKIFDNNKINKEINSQKNKDLIAYYETISETIYQIAFDRKRSSFFCDESNNINDINRTISALKKEYQNNISDFVNNISFIKSSHAFKIENLIYNIIYREITILYSQQNIDELCQNIDSKPKKKKKKKKNKKNSLNQNKIDIDDKDNKNTNNINKDSEENKKNNNTLNEDNYSEENEYDNINNNLYSINSLEKNTTNNSFDDEDNIFSNIEKREEKPEKKGIEFAIEMKYLNENGKEIKNEEEEKEDEKEVDGTDLLKELMEIDKEKEKKKKRKKKSNKKKNENETIKKEIKEEEKLKEEIIIKEQKEENTNNINNNKIGDNKIENDMKDNNNNEKNNSKDENNNKKKYKEFFLFPIDHKKKKVKKNKPNKNNQAKNSNNQEILKESDKEYEKIKEIISESSSEKNKNNCELIDKKEITIENKNNSILIDEKTIKIQNKYNFLIQEKTNQIELKGNEKNDNKNSIKIINNTNRIDFLTEFNKNQIVNPNNPIINNYIIIEKDSHKTNPSFKDNFHLNMNNIFINPKNFYPSLIPTFNYPIPYQQAQNYYINEQNEIFKDLSKEILLYEETISYNLNLLKQYKEEIINNIKYYIEKILNENNFQAQLINYGSYETKLSIEISDIDILIKFCKKSSNNNATKINNQQNIEEIISLLYNKINNNKKDFNILQINAIYTASVPVLKIKFNLENIIPNETKTLLKNNYLFNFEEDILQLNFDFTFIEVNDINENKYIPSLEIVSYIQKTINNYKEIKPIILFLKRYMKINKLNSSFHGGLSSYSLFLLVYAYIKAVNISENSIGNYLYGFLDFYSNFNFGIHSINVSLNNPFVTLNELHEAGIMLIDPITKYNVAKSTFKVDQIKSVLMKGVILIRNIIYKKMIGNNNYNFGNNKNLFLDELFKNKNGTIILDPIGNHIPSQISFGKII